MKKIIWVAVALFAWSTLTAQETKKAPFVDFTANLQTNHLWRGLIITDKPMVGVQTILNLDGQNKFTAGFWGGMSFSNESNGKHYKEIDYYIQYADKGFSIGLWDLFNTTDSKDVDIWNYKNKETGHLLDLRTSYNFGETFPLTLEADVLLYGKGDTEPDGADKVKQRYSTYVQLAYPFYQSEKVNLNGFIGAGFSLNGETHLYGDKKHNFDVVNVGLTASKTLKINDWNIPVSATTLWNPSLKVARVQLAVALF